MRNDLITEARATEIINEVSGFLRSPVDLIEPLAMGTEEAMKERLTEAGYEIFLLYRVTRSIASCKEDQNEAIAKQLYIIKNNPTEKVALEITKEGAE